MAAAKVYFYTAPPSYWPTFVQPLLRLLTVSKEVERVVLVDLLIITRKVPVSCIFIFTSTPFTHHSFTAPLRTVLHAVPRAIRRSHASEKEQDTAPAECAEYGQLCSYYA